MMLFVCAVPDAWGINSISRIYHAVSELTYFTVLVVFVAIKHLNNECQLSVNILWLHCDMNL